MNNNKPEMEELLKKAGGKIDREALERAKQTGDTSALLSGLSAQDKEKLATILNDKEQLKKVLASPQAQLLMKLFGGGKNG